MTVGPLELYLAGGRAGRAGGAYVLCTGVSRHRSVIKLLNINEYSSFQSSRQTSWGCVSDARITRGGEQRTISLNLGWLSRVGSVGSQRLCSAVLRGVDSGNVGGEVTTYVYLRVITQRVNVMKLPDIMYARCGSGRYYTMR